MLARLGEAITTKPALRQTRTVARTLARTACAPHPTVRRPRMLGSQYRKQETGCDLGPVSEGVIRRRHLL